MAETTERERKKLFVQLMYSLKEYTTEVIADQEAVKPIVLELLKFHHPIKLVDYEYGLSRSLKKNHRLIIKESEDKTKAREYIKIATSWYCSNRVSQRSIRCTSANLEIKYGIVFAPNNHNDICIAKDYSYVMKIQGFYKQGKSHEARSFIKKNGSSSNKSLTDSMLEDSILNEPNLSALADLETATPLS
uniref:Uncharacterized protein n=1 Tax=Panagrolaimus davidi TaxID=227884 RepID=A0A914QLC6_9BILA